MKFFASPFSHFHSRVILLEIIWVEFALFVQRRNRKEHTNHGNRITISICDEEYTFVAEEAPSYMQKVGSYVNDKMSELLDAAKVGRTDAAVLTAVNITDELFKEREAGDALRRQVKQYLDEASQAKNEVSELKREIFKLQQQKK